MTQFDRRDEFGNFEANLWFLNATGLLRPSARVLEIGSGRGRLLRWLIDRGHDARGIDLNPELVSDARRLTGGDVRIARAAGERLPFADGSFDLVLSFDVFEHIPDSDAHLREVRRVLSVAGYYLLQTPNKWTNVVFETIRWRSFTAFRSEHCSLHSYRELLARFARHGFDIRFHDVPVVTDFFRQKIRHYLGAPGLLALRLANPDRWPLRLRTNFYVSAQKR